MSAYGLARIGIFSLAASLVFPMGCALAGSPSGQSLATEARAAKSQFRPLAKADAQAAWACLVAAIGDLDKRLAVAGKKGENWRNYVLWDQIDAQLRAAEPDAAALGPVYARFAAGYEGLELRWFARVRQALRQYLEVAGAVDNPALKTAYEERLDQLATQLESWSPSSTTEVSLAIAEAATWLEDARQAPTLVRAVRDRFGSPNFHAQIGAEVVAAGIAAPVDQVEPIEDVILGTIIHGTGHTVGRTDVRLVPDPNCGVVDTLLLATNNGQNVGSHHPVCIYSCSITDIGACKRFWVDDCGLHAYPAVSRAETRTNITDIQDFKGRQIVERFAWRKAGKQQPLAEAIASEHAIARVNCRVDEQADPLIQETNARYEEKVRKPLNDRLAFPRSLEFSTSADFLWAKCVEASAQQLAAPTTAPPLTVPVDLAIRLHESAANNLTATVLSGMVLREDMLQSALMSLLGRIPEELLAGADEDKEPWIVVFAKPQPVTVSFAKNGFTATLRGREFFKGDRGYPGMNVTVSYKFVKAAQGFKAVRDGELQIFPPGFDPAAGQQLGVRHQAIRTLLQKRLGKVLEPELVPKGFTLSGKWAAAGKFEPVEMAANDGWLTIGWRRSAPAAIQTASNR